MAYKNKKPLLILIIGTKDIYCINELRPVWSDLFFLRIYLT
jgi:hypothetical protein